MLNSLYLYTKNISSLAFRKERNIAVLDVKRLYFQKGNFIKPGFHKEMDKSQALDDAIRWLMIAQKNMSDDGMGSYHLVDGWSSSYPETSGYIIPTLMVYGGLTGNDESIQTALKVAEWLLFIQKESGGWQGGRVNEQKPEIVFNTGQVIRGMLAAYAHTQDDRFLKAATKAGDWLCQVQSKQGYWKMHALMENERVYDTYVDAPLLMLSDHTRDKKYAQHAIKNLDWVVDHKQHANAWFEDCDNTIKHNDRPILHTIAYTIDGLLDSGIHLENDKYKQAALQPAIRLRDIFIRDGKLHGRYDANWAGSEYMILTGCAQMSIVWQKLFVLTGDQQFFDAALGMNTLLANIQNRQLSGSDNTKGAIPGSFPIWGKYEPFAFPNWATKYFADALILEQNLKKS